MKRIVEGRILAEPLGMLADCYDGPESITFFKKYNNRSPRQIAEEKFWSILDDLGLIEKERPYILSYKQNFPYVNFIVDINAFFEIFPNFMEILSKHFNDAEILYIKEMIE